MSLQMMKTWKFSGLGDDLQFKFFYNVFRELDY